MRNDKFLRSVFLFVFITTFLTAYSASASAARGWGSNRGWQGSSTGGSTGSSTGGSTGAQAGIWRPAPRTTWNWQLTGNINTSVKATMYDIDLFDAPQDVINTLHAQGKIVICYMEVGGWENWRPDANQFPASVKGRSNGWPGEKWIDIRQIDKIGPIMQARMDLAVSKHCDGIEPDLDDGYSNNTGFPLTYQDQINYNRWLAAEAHARNLSIGLKNDPEQASDLAGDFDWALDEECHQYSECNLLLPFISAGKAVFNAEYTGDPARFCPQSNNDGFSTLKLPLALDGSFRVDCLTQ